MNKKTNITEIRSFVENDALTSICKLVYYNHERVLSEAMFLFANENRLSRKLIQEHVESAEEELIPCFPNVKCTPKYSIHTIIVREMTHNERQSENLIEASRIYAGLYIDFETLDEISSSTEKAYRIIDTFRNQLETKLGFELQSVKTSLEEIEKYMHDHQ